jgi:glycosyltransferase involved in cell wall biosynthesis
LSISKKVLILSYYWPPSGGSGVQRWMYFAKYLKQLGWEPIVITVDEKQASYPELDQSLLKEVEGIRVIKTATREPLRLYSRLTSGSASQGIPQGEVNTKSIFGQLAAYIRGNYFIPDARKGWVPFAVKAAIKLLKHEKIEHLITTGPPHSTHLAGLQLINLFPLNWWVDFRDPWTDVFYNNLMRRSKSSQAKDAQLERTVLQRASGIITTIGGKFHQNLKAKAPGQNVITLANGFDAELMNGIDSLPPKEVFHVVYTGLLTQQQAYPSILKTLRQLKGDRPIRFSLAGNISDNILDEIRTALPNVEVVYHGYLDHAAAIALMKSGHLLLNFIFSGATTQMISGKLLEYFATQIPVLSLGDPLSAAGEFIAKGSCAKMIDSEDHIAIRAFVQELFEGNIPQKNKMEDLEQWSRKAITQRLIKTVLS